MFQQIVYYSISKKTITEKLILEILDSSRNNNSKKNITGCLLYHNNIFLQLLEGKKNDIIDLFETIKNDHRHYEVTQIIEENTDERIFTDWSMAFHKVDDSESNIEKFKSSIGYFSKNVPQKTEALDLFWRMAKQIVN